MSEPRADRPQMPGYQLASVSDGELLPWSWVVERLERSRNYFISTTRPDGRPHSMPVWGVWLNDAFWFNTGSRSRKVRNLATNAQCVITTEGADECAIVEGEAQRVTDAGDLARFVDAYRAKYDWSLAESADPTFVVRPRVVFGFVEAADRFAKTATRWRFE